MDLKTELRIRELLELIRMENNLAEKETQFGDGWLYDHAGVIHEYHKEISDLLNPAQSTKQEELCTKSGREMF